MNPYNTEVYDILRRMKCTLFFGEIIINVRKSYIHQRITRVIFAILVLMVSAQDVFALQLCKGERQVWDNCIGEIRFPSGDRYLGGFQSGRFYGIGIYEKQGGGGYIGEWRDNVPHGVGRSSNAYGNGIIEGKWANGRVIDKELVNISSITVEIEFLYNSALSKNKIENAIALDSQVGPVNTIKENFRDQPASTPLRVSEERERTEISLPKSNSPRLALLIGNANYKMSPLRNPTNDVRALHKALEQVEFTVMSYENLDFKSMRRVIREFGEKITEKHVALFYFSGHGIQVDGKNYLIPVDIDIKYEDEVASSAVEVGFMLSKLEAADNVLNMVILDACRDSPLTRRSRSVSKGLSNVSAASGTLIAFSTAPGRVAFDGDGANSPYTKHLVNAISQKGLLLEQVFKSVRADVMKETKGQQVPWENSSIVGDFYFSR